MYAFLCKCEIGPTFLFNHWTATTQFSSRIQMVSSVMCLLGSCRRITSITHRCDLDRARSWAERTLSVFSWVFWCRSYWCVRIPLLVILLNLSVWSLSRHLKHLNILTLACPTYFNDSLPNRFFTEPLSHIIVAYWHPLTFSFTDKTITSPSFAFLTLLATDFSIYITFYTWMISVLSFIRTRVLFFLMVCLRSSAKLLTSWTSSPLVVSFISFTLMLPFSILKFLYVLKMSSYCLLSELMILFLVAFSFFSVDRCVTILFVSGTILISCCYLCVSLYVFYASSMFVISGICYYYFCHRAYKVCFMGDYYCNISFMYFKSNIFDFIFNFLVYF